MSRFDTMHLKLVVSDYWDSADFYKSLGNFFLTFVKDYLLTVLLGHGEKNPGQISYLLIISIAWEFKQMLHMLASKWSASEPCV